MPWITLTATDVRTRLTGPELAAAQAAALQGGQGDPLPDVVAQVVAEARGYIAGHASNRLDADTSTIPAALQSAVLAIIRYRLLTRLPVKSLLTEDRVKENEQALLLLRMVARGEFAVDAPAAAAPVEDQQAGGGAVLISAAPRHATAQSLRNLL
jgi:phage gp36-like protein